MPTRALGTRTVISAVILIPVMHSQNLLSRMGKIGLALALMTFSAVGTAGFMECFFRMSTEPVVAVETPSTEDCCASEKAVASAPQPEPEPHKCCCISAVERSVVEVNQSAPVAFQLDFPILLEPKPEFNIESSVVTTEQIRWPEVHGPPGIVLSPASPRAPPVA